MGSKSYSFIYMLNLCIFFFSFDFNLLRMKILKLEILNVLINNWIDLFLHTSNLI